MPARELRIGGGAGFARGPASLWENARKRSTQSLTRHYGEVNKKQAATVLFSRAKCIMVAVGCVGTLRGRLSSPRETTDVLKTWPMDTTLTGILMGLTGGHGRFRMYKENSCCLRLVKERTRRHVSHGYHGYRGESVWFWTQFGPSSRG